jgi:hypothetical protein
MPPSGRPNCGTRRVSKSGVPSDAVRGTSRTRLSWHCCLAWNAEHCGLEWKVVLPDGDRPVYCTRCGSIVDTGDRFCGVCGARVSPSAQESAPTRQMPAPSYAPPRVSGGSNSLALPLILGLAAVLLVLIGIGAKVGFALVSGGDTNAPQSSANEPAPAEDREPTQEDVNKGAEASQPQPSRSSAWATPSKLRA